MCYMFNSLLERKRHKRSFNKLHLLQVFIYLFARREREKVRQQ